MSRYITMTFCGTALALAVGGAAAQNAPPPAPTPPAAVGLTPAEAAEAARQAIPRSDTGTVVRTAPSPAERVRPATPNSTGSTTSAAGTGPSAAGGLEPANTPGAVGPGAPATSVDTAPPASPMPPVRAARRSPRADRN